MATFEHIKIQCPFCSWCKRTLHFPDHLLRQHVSEIRIRPIPTDHCIYASVTKNKDDIEFSACLTCGKGAMGDGTAGNTARWISMHAKKAECKKDHHTKLLALRESIKSPLSPLPAAVAAVAVEAPSPGPNFQSHWNKLKKIKLFTPFMLEMEEYCEKEWEHDEPFVFNAAEGFETSIRIAVSDRKKSSDYPAEMTKQQSGYELELTEMRRELHQLRQQVECLQEDTIYKSHEILTINKRLSMLEKENKQYKTAYPAFEPGDPQ